jgi:hypothetical protein
MKIVNAMVGSLLLAAVPLAAQAEDMSYSYVEAGYTEADLDSVADGDGFAVRGSIGFAENFFAFAEYATFGFPASVDLDQISVGLGGHLGISERVDLVGRVGYTEFDLSVPGLGSDSVDGYLVSAGIRGQVTDAFELEGHAVYTDLGSGAGDSTALVAGGRYLFTENFAVGAEYRTGDDLGGTDLDVIYVGVRFTF